MPVKFEWDLDPGSGEAQSCFSWDAEEMGNDKSCCGGWEECCRRHQSPFLGAYDPEASGCEAECESYCSPVSVPNDDVWKKFDILDTVESFDLDEELSGVPEDSTWTSPSYSQSVTKNARELRNHDCMWAGHCISEKHDRSDQKIQKCVNLLPVRKPAKPEEGGTAAAEGGKACARRKAVVAPTHARSILLPTRIVNGTGRKSGGGRGGPAPHATGVRSGRAKTLDSGGESPRPETPQSLSDNEDLSLDLPDLKAVEDFVAESFGYNFIDDIASVGSEDSNGDESGDDLSLYLLDRAQPGEGATHGASVTPPKGAASKAKRTVLKQEAPIARHYTTYGFFSDHCYHLNKNARMDNLGVQTPSDSEEEIDVETVYGDVKKPNGRSNGSGAVLPTNPSLSDRHQLQLTVASAITKKDVKKQGARTASVPARYGLDDRTLKPKMVACKRKSSARNELRRTGGGSKRGSAQFEDCEYVSRTVKKKKYQRHFKSSKSQKSETGRRSNARSCGAGSSDSEADTMERRTIHNSMERQRRIDLRNAFEELRKLIPYTAGNEKAAKIVILNYGAEFCRSLAVEDSELTKKRAELRRQQEMLMARVSHLRRSLAAQR